MIHPHERLPPCRVDAPPGYRVIAGREPEQASSARRIVLGVAGGLFAFLLLIAVFVVVVVVTEALKPSPQPHGPAGSPSGAQAR